MNYILKAVECLTIIQCMYKMKYILKIISYLIVISFGIGVGAGVGIYAIKIVNGLPIIKIAEKLSNIDTKQIDYFFEQVRLLHP